MRTWRAFLGLGGLLLLGIALLYPLYGSLRAQTGENKQAPCCGPDHPVAPRELDFPYYSLRDGFNSALLLVSASPKPVDLTIAIRSQTGETLLAPPMPIQPQEKLTLDLRSLLSELGADFSGTFGEGSVSVYFEGTIMPVTGQLTLTNPQRSLSLESEMVDNSPGLGLLPKMLNGSWWGLGGGREARIMVSNTSGNAVTADVFLDFGGERHASAPLTFAPHETKLLSIAQMLADLNLSPTQAPEGGITIVSRGPTPALIAQGRITDPTRGFSTTLNFLEPDRQRASALHASGVPVGKPAADSPYAGTGTFTPHVIVRNLTVALQSVTITLEYPGEKGPERATLAPVALEGFTTKDLSLDASLVQLPLPLPFCSIRIQYSGPPGSVVGEVSSIEQRGDLVIDSRLANEGDGWAGSGANPWHLDKESESILFLTNMSDKECRIGFQVQANGVHYYLTKLKLKPHESRAIDLRKLRDAQEPDYQKSKIPTTATDGSVLWTRLDNVQVTGRLVVLQRHNGFSSTYDCNPCPCPPDFSFVSVSPATVDLPPGAPLSWHVLAMNSTATV